MKNVILNNSIKHIIAVLTATYGVFLGAMLSGFGSILLLMSLITLSIPDMDQYKIFTTVAILAILALPISISFVFRKPEKLNLV